MGASQTCNISVKVFPLYVNSSLKRLIYDWNFIYLSGIKHFAIFFFIDNTPIDNIFEYLLLIFSDMFLTQEGFRM